MRTVARIIAIVGFATMTLAAQKGGVKQMLAQNNVLAQVQTPPPSPPLGSDNCIPCTNDDVYVGNDEVEDFVFADITCEAAEVTCEQQLNAPVATQQFQATVVQEVALSEIPAQVLHQFEESACCSTEAERHAAVARACKTRNFDITGNICVQETVEFHESEFAKEQAVGYAQSNSCSTEYAEEQLAAGVNCQAIAVEALTLECEPDNNGVGASPKK
jgi:hypothetical protein